MKETKSFLRELTRLLPPGDGQRHNITFEDDTLTISLMLGENYYPFTLDESDLRKDGQVLAKQIYEQQLARV